MWAPYVWRWRPSPPSLTRKMIANISPSWFLHASPPTLSHSQPSSLTRHSPNRTTKPLRIPPIPLADVQKYEKPTAPRCTRRSRPLTSRASVWTASMSGKIPTGCCIGSFRLPFVRFSYSPFALGFCFRFHSTPSCFALAKVAASPHSITRHTRTCCQTPCNDSVNFQHHCSIHRLRRCVALLPAVPSSSSYFFSLCPPFLAHFVSCRVLNSYFLGPAYINPAPGLVKGGHFATHFSPSSFVLCAFSEPLLVCLVLCFQFSSCRFRSP